jgi:RNA polymerase sigma-70 factor (ECF subfamily)
MLLSVAPSAVGRLNRAIAVWQLDGPAAAIRDLDVVAAELDGYHIYHATRGELLSQLGRLEQAKAECLRALDLTQNRAEQSLLQRRLFH